MPRTSSRPSHYLTHREDLAAYREVRERYLGDLKPASTLLFISGLAHPDMLVEVVAAQE